MQYSLANSCFFQPVLVFHEFRWDDQRQPHSFRSCLCRDRLRGAVGVPVGALRLNQHRYQQQFLDLQGHRRRILVMATVYVKDNDIEFASGAEEDGSARGISGISSPSFLRKTLGEEVRQAKEAVRAGLRPSGRNETGKRCGNSHYRRPELREDSPGKCRHDAQLPEIWTDYFALEWPSGHDPRSSSASARLLEFPPMRF